nr:NADH dehydrogenase subunit 2 [Chelonus formosanus]UHY94326.1 NADH dehydrogenase subunit 2 [Chelonus formosanus]
MKKLNNWIIILLLINPLMIFSMNNWMNLWMNMEMNMLIFLTFIILNNKYLYDLPMKYYLINSLSSMIFFMMMNLLILNNLMVFKYLMNLMMMIKLGLFPFYYWFLEMMIFINWMSCFFLSVWQKLFPLYLINLLMLKDMNMIFVIFNGIFSMFMVINEYMLKKIFSYSSINHMIWMILILMVNIIFFFVYYIIYLMLNFMLMMIFKKINVLSLVDLLNESLNMNIYFIMIIISIGGLPPFLGFLMKFMLIYEMILHMKFFLILMLIFFSLFFLYFYMRLSLNYMMMNFMKLKFYIYKLFYNNFYLILNIKIFNMLNLLMMFIYIIF